MTDDITLQCARCGRSFEDIDDPHGFHCSLACALVDLPDFA